MTFFFLQTKVVEKIKTNILCTRVSHMKALDMFYLIIYWTQKVYNDFTFLCSILLPPVGHSSNHDYHCWNLQDNRAVVRIFIALLRFSVNSPSQSKIIFK